MYDRKKVTLFILLIATVVLGGLALFLAVQLNNNQAPDDSAAGAGVCKGIQPGNDEICSVRTEGNCNGLCIWVPTPTVCTIVGQTGTVGPGQTRCDSFTNYQEYSCPASGGVNATLTGNTCEPQTTPRCSAPGGQVINEGSSLCNSGTNFQRYSCINGNAAGSNAALALNEFCRPAGGQCTQGGVTECASGFCCNCAGGAKCSANGSGSDCTSICGGSSTATATAGGGDTTATATATATAGGNNSGGGNTSTCTSTAPTAARLTGPANGAVLNTTTATLSWDRNGTFGEGCANQNNQFRVRMMTVGLNEACPTNTNNNSAYSRVGTVDGGPTGSFNLTVENGKKYCWTIRKHNGAQATDSGVRYFTVDIATPNPVVSVTTGIPEEETSGTTTSDPDTTATGGYLPGTAIISDELDPILLGMLLIIVGLVFYKFDIPSFKRNVEEQ